MNRPRTQARQIKRPWRETRMSFTRATAIVFDGPDREWLLVLRGERTRPPRIAGRKAKGGRP